ncbi:MAG TPA: hypothetical protein VFZ61_16820 [Polyangiales bacterium]
MVLLGALLVEGCGASTTQGAQVRVHTTSAAFEHHVPSQAFSTQHARKAGRKESPLVHACKAGSSKSCNELGDRLAIKHAYTEARQWYGASCDRVRGAMHSNAERLMLLSQHLKQAEVSAATIAELKGEAAEIKARVQGCFDTGEMVKVDGELKQAVGYYEAACEFSTLIEAVGEAVPSLEHVTESACAAGESARAKLSNNVPFKPQQFADLLQPKQKPAAAKGRAAQAEDSMVFTGDE